MLFLPLCYNTVSYPNQPAQTSGACGRYEDDNTSLPPPSLIPFLLLLPLSGPHLSLPCSPSSDQSSRVEHKSSHKVQQVKVKVKSRRWEVGGGRWEVGGGSISVLYKLLELLTVLLGPPRMRLCSSSGVIFFNKKYIHLSLLYLPSSPLLSNSLLHPVLLLFLLYDSLFSSDPLM